MKGYFNLPHSCLWLWKTALVDSSDSPLGRGVEGIWQCLKTALGSQRGRGSTGILCTEPRDAAQYLTTSRVALTAKNYPTLNAEEAKVEKPWPIASQTYHLIHGVTRVVIFRVGASNPHRLKKFFFLLLIFVRQCLLWLFFLD